MEKITDIYTQQIIGDFVSENLLEKKIKMVRHQGGMCFRAVIEGGIKIECTITNVEIDQPEPQPTPSRCFTSPDGQPVHVVTMGDQACSCGARKMEYIEKEY